MADIFREVDEDLRRDNFTQLWKKYGGIVIGVALLLVLTTALFVGWREWRISRNVEMTERLAVAGEMAAAGNTVGAIAAYRSIADDAGGGHRILARLNEAALAAEVGDRDGAVAVYDAIAASDAERAYRDLGLLLRVMHSAENGDAETLIASLAPLMTENNSWRFSARELTALLEHRRGNGDRAIELYSGLAASEEAPPDLRSRAQEMLSALGADNEG